MSLSYTMVTSRQELLQYEQSILGLFFECFSKALDPALWKWAFFDNPVGPPVVSLCFNENRTLIGHYAVIPIPLQREGISILAGLSMTTMVHASYRRYGVFSIQAQQVYDEAYAMGYRLVYGFPNSNSLAGFRKRLGWTIHTDDYVACLAGKELATNDAFINELRNRHLIALDIYDESFLTWRLAKPGAEYSRVRGSIVKKYHPYDDLVFASVNLYQRPLPDDRFNVLVDGSAAELRKHHVFDYPFGYKVFDDSLGATQFKKDLLMSDVF
jgi:hypothetical protein